LASLNENSRNSRLNVFLHSKVVEIDAPHARAEHQWFGFKYSSNLVNSFHLVDDRWSRGDGRNVWVVDVPPGRATHAPASAPRPKAPAERRKRTFEAARFCLNDVRKLSKPLIWGRFERRDERRDGAQRSVVRLTGRTGFWPLPSAKVEVVASNQGERLLNTRLPARCTA
jgi:hypothetical protein